MYSPSVVRKRIQDLKTSHNIIVRDISDATAALFIAQLNAVLGPDSKPTRDLTSTELDFIRNEVYLSRCDFHYWRRRYGFFIDSTGTYRVMDTLWESQILFFDKIARMEEESYRLREEGSPAFGTLIAYMKARQLGASTDTQMAIMHGINFYSNVQGLTAASTDLQTAKIHEKAELAYDSMPWWMKSSIKSRAKKEGMVFESRSRIALQNGAQESAVGQGGTWKRFHLTEMPSWQNVGAITHDFFPAIADSVDTFGIMESTAQIFGDWWHVFSENCRKGDVMGWDYLFVPWYAESTRYRRNPPGDWTPSSSTLLHAQRVEESSPEFMAGRTVRLDKAQLYWYETKRDYYTKNDELAQFLANWCATPEEAFQHATGGAFQITTIETLMGNIRPPSVAMEPATSPEPVIRSTMVQPASSFTITPITPEILKDPRGYLLVYEQPLPDASYVIGADPSYGLAGWSPHHRLQNDHRTDNAALSVVKLPSRPGEPDALVAEYAGPIDAESFGRVLNSTGRLYRGRDDMAFIILEVQPGPGILTLRVLVDRYEYTSLFRWRTLDSYETSATKSLGWYATPRSVSYLWSRGSGHIVRNQIMIPSAYTVQELKSCQLHPTLHRGEAPPGSHDDRVRSTMLALWAAHDWSDVLASDYSSTPQDPATATDPGVHQYTILTDDEGNLLISQSDMNSSWERRTDLVYRNR